ncbi:probable nucleoporin Nup54 [Helicoverpa armigera]|uniref:probable nucleoporin Nup54 n=1 Tax=Helicoverpa armigera TaxID=29058 RepID=UPI0030832AF7
MAFSFGTPSTQSSTFGAAAKPTFSFGGGATTTTSSAFGGFGTPATSTGFGSFGAPATSTATPFGGLGTTPASTAPSLFGGTGFGTTAAKPTTGFGNTSFGANTFGTTPAFGNTSFGSAAPTFGSAAPTFGTNTLGANTFGNTSFGAGGGFGSSFGAKSGNTGFGGFGNTLGSAPQFGQQQQQQPQQQQGPSSAHEALVAAVFNCCVFGDERDQVLAKWNLIQAQWGTGQAYYSRNAPPLELNEQNPLCRFKAVGYSRLGGREDKDGHVAMLFNKPEQEIKNNQQALTTSLHSLLGNKPNLAVNVECVKAVSESKSQVVIYVVDKGAGGSHVSASELGAFLSAGNARNALTGAGCASVSPVTAPSQQMLTQYLQTAPPGMDMRLWKQAQADNPDPENYIPVPIIGFSEIKFRSRCQSEQAKLQAQWLQRAAGELAELRTRRAAAAARLAHLAARLHARRHTLLQVVARREVVGRVGAALSPEEEAARARLHELTSQLAAPPLYNGRLNELLCAVRLQRSACTGAPHERYHLDPGAQEDVKQFLSLQQKGMAHLLDTARKDLAALGIIAEGMSRLVRA